MTKRRLEASPVDQRRRLTLRTPSRSRGVLRYEALVDATERLLAEHHPDDVGLYQIAEAANAAPASVYHFFPTKEAAFLALTLRYAKTLGDNSLRPLPSSALESWQSLLKWDERNAMTFINSRPAALKLMYGGYGGMDTRQADIAINKHLAHLTQVRLNQAFHMPAFRDAERKFHIGLEMIDAIWSISYLYEGKITEAYFEESHAANIAYCRLFLPERIDLKDEHRQQLDRGEDVLLPPLPPLDPRQIVPTQDRLGDAPQV